MSVIMPPERRRHRLLTDVLADIATSGDPTITRIDEVVAEFGDLDGLLLAAQHRWYTAVFARLDAILEDTPEHPAQAVAQLWTDLAADRPGLRMLLDTHAERPALAAADRHHRAVVLRDLGVDLAALPVPPGPATGPPDQLRMLELVRRVLRAMTRRVASPRCPLRMADVG